MTFDIYSYDHVRFLLCKPYCPKFAIVAPQKKFILLVY